MKDACELARAVRLTLWFSAARVTTKQPLYIPERSATQAGGVAVWVLAFCLCAGPLSLSADGRSEPDWPSWFSPGVSLRSFDPEQRGEPTVPAWSKARSLTPLVQGAGSVLLE